MSKAFIGLGAKTTHGGIVVESEPSFIMKGIAVHLNGMKHYCPKCQTMVTAISSDLSVTVKGRAIVIAGDKASCGAIFLPMQHLTVSQK
ncbi:MULTISPECIES: PAAR domain-containing protein [unclassified Acinetobacter]|uniref:PAAR domain-containing protein n=1 Tax=unclassified Acinetobacter TaxID=196816 RepID=UPI0015D2500E|nr:MULTISPECIES: PAAR domain-containing protein [unclassified Acinetobacter]